MSATWQSIATPLIQHYEAFRADAYLCPAGVWTIGWGSTGADIQRGMRWTRAHADTRFAADLERFGGEVSRRVRVPLKPCEMAALVSLVYNIGGANFERSTLLRKLNAGDKIGAAEQFAVWNKARVNGHLAVLNGLVRRRAHEARVFRGEVG
jgi:lysozyme